MRIYRSRSDMLPTQIGSYLKQEHLTNTDLMVMFSIFRRPPRESIKPLLFMHIHKTGGQSLSRFLEQFFAPEEVCPHNTDFAILACSPRELERYRFFRGHISMNGLSKRVRSFSTVTVLRDPKDRLVSAFYYWQRMAASDAPHLPTIMRRFPTMTFADFLSDSATHHCCDNVQARLLTGGWFGTTNNERIMVYGDPDTRNRKQLSYIGTTDALDEAARDICKLMGFQVPIASEGELVGRVNVGTRPTLPLSALEESLVSERTHFDWEVYRSIKKAQDGWYM